MSIIRNWWRAITGKPKNELKALSTRKPGYAASPKNLKLFKVQAVVTINGRAQRQFEMDVKGLNRDNAAKRAQDSLGVKVISARPARVKKIVAPEKLHK
jgi:hypothetical protein